MLFVPDNNQGLSLVGVPHNGSDDDFKFSTQTVHFELNLNNKRTSGADNFPFVVAWISRIQMAHGRTEILWFGMFKMTASDVVARIEINAIMSVTCISPTIIHQICILH